jgi:murein L,D-transpeptidase YcbB/YkuD
MRVAAAVVALVFLLVSGAAAYGDAGATDVQRFYEARAFAPAWSGSVAALRTRRFALDLLGHAADEGLEPSDYAVAPEGRGPSAATQYDMALTAAVLRFMHDLRSGRMAPAAVDRDIGLPDNAFDTGAALNAALEYRELPQLFKQLAPPHPQYRGLKQALARYRVLTAQGSWTPTGPEARDWRENDAVAQNLWRRLGLEDASLAGAEFAAKDLDTAIRRFQARNGLEPDGRIGPKTLAALNVTALARVEQIIANMERWRWVPRDLGPAYIAVNAADATLTVVDAGRVVLTSRIVAGKPATRTPVFAATVVAVTVNPSWHIPPPIARNEIWPRERAHPGYLASQHIVVEGNALRQLPGEHNALGRVKLEMPNRFNAYLHDTPAKALFARGERHFSHGCMRVQEILPLASYALMRDPSADIDRINTAIAAGETLRISLDRPLPVYVLYWTVIAHEDGTLDFRRDIYGRDTRLLAALSGQRPVGRVARTDGECQLATG